MKICLNCARRIEGAVSSFPWEAGNNPYAYVRCPYCGYKNIQDGYGEDDD